MVFSSVPATASFFSTSASALGTAERGIELASLSKTGQATKLRRDEQKEVQIFYGIVRSKQLKRKELDSALTWLLDKDEMTKSITIRRTSMKR